MDFAVDHLHFLLTCSGLAVWECGSLVLSSHLKDPWNKSLMFLYQQVFSYQSMNLVHCETVMRVVIRRASGRSKHAGVDPSVWKQELPRCCNFWWAPLGAAVRCCLQCWAAGALVLGYVAWTKIQFVKYCLLSTCVSGITSFFNGDTEFFKPFFCSVHQTQRAEGKILNGVHLFCTSQA